MKQLLKFALGNKKLQKGEAIFDLPASHSCLFAKSCRSSADRVTGKITDGPHMQFRCYAASCEARATTVRNARWHNFELLKKQKGKGEIVSLILKSMPDVLRYRIHSSGDFYSQTYFDAWLEVARKFPNRTFYCYTKALPFYLKRKDDMPANFIVTASYGGTHDFLIGKNSLKFCQVVESVKEARAIKLPLDKDDSHAWNGNKSFALIVHGPGAKGTVQAMLQYQKTIAARA